MPGKHVRFSGKTTLYSPAPNTHLPSLTRKDYSPASSDSLPTPPVFPTSIPPTISGGYSYPVVVPSYKSARSIHRPPPIRIHHVLEYPSRIYFDVRQHPATIRARRPDLSSSILSEPATSPASQRMCLTSPHIPWAIQAKPTGYSHSSRKYYVTVADVLDAIYFTLRANITPTEYASLGAESKAQSRVKHAYEDRYRRIKDSSAYKEEKRGGVKRVDFLAGYNKFSGLTPRYPEEGEWEVHTGK